MTGHAFLDCLSDFDKVYAIAYYCSRIAIGY
jgi:hypothetical protein